jgi:hypothetical protein
MLSDTKSQVIKLWNCCILLVNLFEFMTLVWLELLTVLTTKNSVLWEVNPYSSAHILRLLEEFSAKIFMFNDYSVLY